MKLWLGVIAASGLLVGGLMLAAGHSGFVFLIGVLAFIAGLFSLTSQNSESSSAPVSHATAWHSSDTSSASSFDDDTTSRSLHTDHLTDPAYSWMPGNIYHSSHEEHHHSSFDDHHNSFSSFDDSHSSFSSSDSFSSSSSSFD